MHNAGLDKDSLQMLLDTISSFGKQKLSAKVRASSSMSGTNSRSV